MNKQKIRFGRGRPSKYKEVVLKAIRDGQALRYTTIRIREGFRRAAHREGYGATYRWQGKAPYKYGYMKFYPLESIDEK